KKDANTFTDSAEAGPDFHIQGEYEGKLGGAKLGAQVVALGEGKFDIYFLTGGLPGAGWDTKGRTQVEAKTASGKTTCSATGWEGNIAENEVSGKSPDGEFILKRVERKSPTLGAKAPAGALVLFDGKSADEWAGGKVVEKDLLFCGTTSKKKLGAGKLHVEF